jgi:MFS family permease
MFSKLRLTVQEYPSQFWLIACGVLFASSGSSLIWPFQLVYVSQTLQKPLSEVAALITISALIGLVVSFFGGAIADKLGRKPIMVAAQATQAAAFLLMSRAHTYLGFLLPMAMIGSAMPFYAIGSDAMMADMLPMEKRNAGYSILRMMNNAGIAVGPAIGGLLIARSYSLAFYGAAGAMLIYSLVLLAFSRETLTGRKTPAAEVRKPEPLGGYLRVLKDGHYVAVVLSVALGLIAPLMMWTLLAVYTKTNFGLPEYQYAWIPVTNALMCVFVQYFVTMITRRYRPLPVITVGMLVYALGVGSVALMRSLLGFWISIVIITFGELILIPTGTTYAANRAPADLRGRYMTVYWLTWGLARAAAPVIGGFLNDQISPRAIWTGGLAFGLVSTVILAAISVRTERRPAPAFQKIE